LVLPALFAIGVFVLFAVFFRSEKVEYKS